MSPQGSGGRSLVALFDLLAVPLEKLVGLFCQSLRFLDARAIGLASFRSLQGFCRPFQTLGITPRASGLLLVGC